jgi:protocatechuate 3,4-dioxygenase beta subunit
MESPTGRNPWLTAALLCAAMLIVPLAGWLLFPKPSAPILPPAPVTVTQQQAVTETSEGAEARPPQPATPRTRPADREPRADEATGAKVAGLVLDAEGKPVARAIVTCEERNLTTTTNEEGRFELGPEAAGCAAVSMHPGHSPSASVRLAAGDGNVLRLLTMGAISGVVLDEAGTPVASYLLAIESFLPSADEDASPIMGRPRTFADPTGQFLLERLPPGRYVLTASADARPPARSASITVEAGRTTHHVRITLARGAMLSGTILDADTRQPIAGARIALDAATSSGANAIEGTSSDASGAYSLKGVPPGPFSVRVSRDGYRTKIVPGLTTRGSPTIREDIALAPRGDAGGGDSELIGIGAVLAPTAAGVVISSVIEGGPADRAGLQGGDRILRIDGTDATAMPLTDCVQRLRGPEGSRVTVGVARRSGGEVELTVVRATIVR